MIGTTVSHYAILERIGGGGMGVVYKARDTRLGRLVALKFLPPELTRDPTAKQRFVQEARTASLLDHPHVCAVHEIDETPDGQVFICMALCDGQPLRNRIAAGPVSVEETLSVAIQVADGLARAHERGIVHRDVKPANLMVGSDGRVQIVDFGLATLAGEARLTRTGVVVGTAAYMSPEQISGAPVDARTDLWSLGVVIYEMLTGRLPFASADGLAQVDSIRFGGFPPIDAVRPGVPARLAAIVGRCLEKDPGRRPADAGELRDELIAVQRALASTSATTQAGLPAAPRRRRVSGKLAIAVGGGAVALAALLALVAALRPLQRRLGRDAATGVQHMAVLPFTNVGNDPANRAFCDGLTEILASTLTQFERFRDTLWVVPASEVRAEKVDSAGAARRAFGVNLAVTGGVQRDGDRLRLALNLVDTASLRQLRSRVIEGEEADVSGLEDRVVAAIAEMLNLQLGTADQTRLRAGGTSLSAAYELYVQARGTLGTYQGERDPQKAAELFERAIALDPSFALAHAGLAEARLELYGWKKDPALVEAAAASARRAVEQAGQLPETHITLGKVYAATGRYEDAASELRIALRLDPTSSAALVELAQTLDSLGRADAAEATYKQAIGFRPDYWLTHSRLASFYARHGRYDQAEAEFKRVIALAPENFWGYNGLGVVYFTLARNAEARAMFERALAIRPSYVLYSNLGTLAFTERNWAEAVAKFEHARAIDDRDYLLWGNLGIAYHWLGGHEGEVRDDVGRAIALARRQLEVNPHDTAVLADLAGYHALLGDRPEALRLVRQVEADGRKKPDLAIQIADVYADLDDRGAAIAWIGAAIRLGLPAADVTSRPGFDRLRGDPRLAKLLQEHREPPSQQGRS